MNQNLEEPTTRVSARRRLVRGAFAAPAALTLYSGSAFAENSMSCLTKEVTHPTYPALSPNPPSSTDTYIRVRLWTLPSDTPSTWVRGFDVVALQKLNTPTPYISGSEWQCYFVGTPAAVTMGSGSITPEAGTVYPGQPSYNLATPVQNGSYAALRVDITGKIVGVVGLGVGETGTSAVHQSCWTSFKPTITP